MDVTSWFQWIIFMSVAVAGTAVVLVRSPRKQVFFASAFGSLLAILFFDLQAPDVALAQITIGAVVVPALILFTISKVDRKYR